MENEKPKGKDRGKVRASLPELDPGLKQPEQHTAHKGTRYMCKGRQQNPKGIIYATLSIYSFFLRIHLVIKGIMWYHVIH